MADRGVFANQGPTRPNIDKSLFDLSHSNNLTARLGRAYPVLVYDAPAVVVVPIPAKMIPAA